MLPRVASFPPITLYLLRKGSHGPMAVVEVARDDFVPVEDVLVRPRYRRYIGVQQ